MITIKILLGYATYIMGKDRSQITKIVFKLVLSGCELEFFIYPKGLNMSDTEQEPSMEEILASIRRIISDDDKEMEAATQQKQGPRG